jgi:tetratricopeptide (TPR) repeat protein
MRAHAARRSLYLACLTALALMLLHEFCDFSLRIPANALLFTVILGIAVRLAAAGSSRQPPAGQRCRRWLPGSMMAAAVVALVAAFGQDLTPFPYNLGDPSSIAEAAERIDRHPAQATGHIMLARLLAPQVPMARQTQLYATAAWLRPSDTNLRDLYASALLNAGERELGLGEVSRSVAMAPSMTRHFYLNDRLLPWLTADEKQAIEAGFQQALARGDLSALENFALFYQRTGQPLAQAKLFNSAAARSTDRRQKMTFILKAAASFAAAGESAEAEKLLRQAVAIEPSDARPYQALALSVYAPQGQRERIAAVIGEALSKTAQPLPLYLALTQAMHRAGASPEASAALRQAVSHIDGAAARGAETVPLFLQLADTAGKVGAFDEEIAALEQVAKLRPSAAEIFQRLGSVYLRGGQHDRAAHAFHRLTELRPQSAEAFFHLGQAEAARSANRAADAAYSRAVELAPNNSAFKARHDEIARQLAVSQPPKSSALDHAGK